MSMMTFIDIQSNGKRTFRCRMEDNKERMDRKVRIAFRTAVAKLKSFAVKHPLAAALIYTFAACLLLSLLVAAVVQGATWFLSLFMSTEMASIFALLGFLCLMYAALWYSALHSF